ncbi:hypothetical protein ABH543_27770 (plasmid) [Escherichia coli]|nr:hypothetical protein ECDEC5B_3480 [Escherichia coli DEC5B]MDZ9726130.1 hypothetical protein [Escherichia coli]
MHKSIYVYETLGEQYGPLLPSALRQSSARNRKNWLFARSDSSCP